MKLIDRYLASAIAVSTLLVLAVADGAVLVSSYSSTPSATSGKANFQLADAARYVLAVVAAPGLRGVPMAALLGTTLGLSALAADSETGRHARCRGIGAADCGGGDEGRVAAGGGRGAGWRIPGAGH